MEANVSFGAWIQKRRKSLDLTQEELAQYVGCSVSALRKIEADERRPSKQLAGLLADCLEIPSEEKSTFIKIARGELLLERLHLTPQPAGFNFIQPPSAQSPRANLPVLPTPLLGRELELTVLRQTLSTPECRMLTLVGPGGIGKTRLAIQTAANLAEGFMHASIFVGLAALDSPSFLVPAIAQALNIKFQDADDPRDQLLHYLCDRHILLVLDNVEHLLEGSQLFSEIIRHAPQVKLLLTSREPLHLQGEWIYEVKGLALPEDDGDEAFDSSSAVSLFLQRARQADVRFILHPQERADVVRVCRLVEGMPLAIELAATWVNTLTCREIAAEIEGSIDILSASMRDLPERHRSMRAVFDHSWRMLSEDEQYALRRLSVFMGGFTRRAADQVADLKLSLLFQLINKSFVQYLSETHYVLHDLVRQYAAEKLGEDAQDEMQTRERHRQYFIDFLTRMHPMVRGPQMLSTLEIIQADLDNILHAWQLTVAERKFSQLRQAEKCLYDFFELRSRKTQGDSILTSTADALREELVSQPNNKELCTLLGLVLTDQSVFKYSSGKLSDILALANEGAECLRVGEDPSAFGFVLLWLANLEYRAGNMVVAEQQLVESQSVFREIGDERGIAAALGMEAKFALLVCRYEAGRQAAKEAELIYRKYKDDDGIGRSLIHLGILEMELGRYEEARAVLRECLRLSKSANILEQVGIVLDCLAQLAQRQDNLEEAQRMLVESLAYLSDQEALFERVQVMLHLSNVLSAEGNHAEARSILYETLNILIERQHIPLLMNALLNMAHLLHREDADEQALKLVFFVSVHPQASPRSKVYADQLFAQLATKLNTQQIEATEADARLLTIETAVAEILNSSTTKYKAGINTDYFSSGV
jgi:predicted ATPase/DNA-binding XRE family transcriptional regulator